MKTLASALLLARRPDRGELSAAQYAEKAAQCAAIASGAGDQADAAWWWFTAIAMDAQRALELLPSLRESGLLLELPPPRSLVGSDTRKSQAGEVLLPNGDLVKGELAKPAKRPEWPKHMFRPVTAVVATEVVVEVLIDTDGRPTQRPRLGEGAPDPRLRDPRRSPPLALHAGPRERRGRHLGVPPDRQHLQLYAVSRGRAALSASSSRHAASPSA
ncbi:MAG TPA: hypothetical protein VNJ70_15255 [Thermoanaerobaculia bacterium]|nr:hypothetical protein [Thermoanaerobaculia bacterium]